MYPRWRLCLQDRVTSNESSHTRVQQSYPLLKPWLRFLPCPVTLEYFSFASGFDAHVWFHRCSIWISNTTADTAMINPSIDGDIVMDPAEQVARDHSWERVPHIAARARLFSWLWARVLLRTSLICCVNCVRAAT